ncbi:MAG: ATP-binding cassette domain-containing protein [Bacillota bacterium]
MSFDVCVGEVFGLIGPNGAGKTTTGVYVCDGLTGAAYGSSVCARI